MRVLAGFMALALFSLPAAAADQVRTYKLGCTNSSDQQWTETQAGIVKLFGADGRFVFSRPDSTVTVTGPNSTQRGVAEMTRGLADATCPRATITYRVIELPPDTDLGALFAAVRAVGASNLQQTSILQVPGPARAALEDKIAAVSGARPIFAATGAVLTRRSETLKGNTAAGAGTVLLSPLVEGEHVTIHTAVEITRPAPGGRYVFSNNDLFTLRPGEAQILHAKDAGGVLLIIVSLDSLTR
jgi:hypothetical protein